MNGGVGTSHMWETSVGVSCGGKQLREMSLGVQHHTEVAPCCPCPPKKDAQHVGKEQGHCAGATLGIQRA